MNFSASTRLIRTLADIGPRRLLRRLRYELRQRLDRWLSPRLAIAWAGCSGQTPHWLPVLEVLELKGVSLPPLIEPRSVTFQFLKLEQQLNWPIRWNDATWPRLWQFHLHYFDWAREWLDCALITGHWPSQAALLEPLIDHWIAANSPGRGDGWHSYTLSLRSRNWIWLFRCCPQLATPRRVRSLWQQLCWLQAHPEHCHGGNHWLENLTALALGGLQFGGSKALAMHRRALRLLEQELASQVLEDGGHEERSASYHLLMLDRLVELGFALSVIKGQRPAWLVAAISAMSDWAKAVRLEGGGAPRFNDSAADAAPPLDEVLAFADGYLQHHLAGRGLRRYLQEFGATGLKPSQPVASASVHVQSVVTDLASTGWTVLRPGYGWELFFKCGVPCPANVPGHVHSDLLSLELCYQGKSLIGEAGTSTYESGIVRRYERSGQAHNVLQLGFPSSDSVTWVEPVEVWGCFRTARKARPRDRHCGELEGGRCFAAGSHDGFDRIGASHSRFVQLSDARPREITLTVKDMVSTRRSLQFRHWWHLAPSVPNELMDSLVFEAPTADAIHSSWQTTWFSEKFGQRIPRHSFCVSGCFPPGEHQLRITLAVSIDDLSRFKVCPVSG